MFTLKSKTGDASGSATPYPSWSAVVDTVGCRSAADDQECRTLREARLWQALADEPVSPVQEPRAHTDAAAPQRR